MSGCLALGQWFSARCDFASRGHASESGAISGEHSWACEQLLHLVERDWGAAGHPTIVSGESGVLLDTLRWVGQLPWLED